MDYHFKEFIQLLWISFVLLRGYLALFDHELIREKLEDLRVIPQVPHKSRHRVFANLRKLDIEVCL